MSVFTLYLVVCPSSCVSKCLLVFVWLIVGVFGCWVVSVLVGVVFLFVVLLFGWLVGLLVGCMCAKVSV